MNEKDVAGVARRSLAGSSLLDALDDCWSHLRSESLQRLNPVTLDVHLSSAYVCIGLLDLPPSESAIGRGNVWENVVDSWTGQVWQLDPDTRITRWQRLNNANAVLVSSTDLSIHETLLSFAKKHRIHLRSCLPAALSPRIMDSALKSSGALHEKDPLASETLILWTECTALGNRIAPVQLLRWAKGSPTAIWRGWLPPYDDIQNDEDSLKGAVRRFLGSSLEGSHVMVLRTRWPNAKDARAPRGEP